MSEGNIAADQLRLHVEAIERLEDEKRGIADDIKDRYNLAKAEGFDVPTIRAVVRLRKLEKHVRQEAAALLETYMNALGMDDMFAGHDGSSKATAVAPGDGPDEGELYAKALQIVIENQKASTSWLQRQLRVGYNSAARLIEKMERAGIVGTPNHTGKREVLMTDWVEGVAHAIREIAERPAGEGAVH